MAQTHLSRYDLGNDLAVTMESEVYDHELLDTTIEIVGRFAIHGCDRGPFLLRLEALIDEMRI